MEQFVSGVYLRLLISLFSFPVWFANLSPADFEGLGILAILAPIVQCGYLQCVRVVIYVLFISANPFFLLYRMPTQLCYSYYYYYHFG